MNDKKVICRFGPSPTGMLHLGGIRTALYNYLFAKKHGGEFLLRIEDTDTERFVPGSEEYLIKSLQWCGIMPDNSLTPEGKSLYKQSEREYQSYINILLEKGHAYYAFDTDEEMEVIRVKSTGKNVKPFSYNNHTRNSMKNSLTLSADEVKLRLDRGDNYVVRFATPKNQEIKFSDIIRGTISVNSNNIDDKVIFKSNGIPTYHGASVIDDHLMGITHVIRAEEWLPSTPLHVLLYRAFEWDIPKFAHLPLVLAPDGSKLSKRKAMEYGFSVFPLTWTAKNKEGVEVTMQGFKEEGYEPDAFINMLALLGWNPGTDKEIYSMDELIKDFSLEGVGKSGARFDIKKAKWFNAIYLRNKSIKDLVKELGHSKNYSKNYSEEELEIIVKFSMERAVFMKDLYPTVDYFFEEPSYGDSPVLKNPTDFKRFADDFTLKSDSKIDWSNPEGIKNSIHTICDGLGIKVGKIMPDFRFILCGNKPGPELHLIMNVLGREETIERLLTVKIFSSLIS